MGKQTCMIPRDLHHTPSMAAYKMIRLKFELACKSSSLFLMVPSLTPYDLPFPKIGVPYAPDIRDRPYPCNG